MADSARKHVSAIICTIEYVNKRDHKMERLLTRLNGICALGCLSRQHHTVGTIKHGVGHIANLGTGWPGVVLV
jgi:hypothetical protein